MTKQQYIMRQCAAIVIIVLFVFVLCAALNPFINWSDDLISDKPLNNSNETLFRNEERFSILALPAYEQHMETNILKGILRLNLNIKNIFLLSQNFKRLILSSSVLTVYLYLYLNRTPNRYRHIISLSKGGHAPPLCPTK